MVKPMTITKTIHFRALIAKLHQRLVAAEKQIEELQRKQGKQPAVEVIINVSKPPAPSVTGSSSDEEEDEDIAVAGDAKSEYTSDESSEEAEDDSEYVPSEEDDSDTEIDMDEYDLLADNHTF